MTDAERKVREMVDNIGALGEMLKIYRDSLLDNGFTREEAIKMCADLTKAILGKDKT